MPNLIEFEWSRMTEGYGIERFWPEDVEFERCVEGYRPIAKVGARASTLRLIESGAVFHALQIEEGWGAGATYPIDYIYPEGTEYLTYRPFDSGIQLFREFSDIGGEPNGVFQFAHRYGLLFNQTPTQYLTEFEHLEDMQTWLFESEKMGRAVEAWEVYNRTKDDIEPLLIEFHSSNTRSSLSVRLKRGADPERPALYIEPDNLFSAIWLQFAQAVSANTQMRRCAVCPTWFAYGTGTGRRKSAHYCSDKCRKAAHRNRERTQS